MNEIRISKCSNNFARILTLNPKESVSYNKSINIIQNDNEEISENNRYDNIIISSEDDPSKINNKILSSYIPTIQVAKSSSNRNMLNSNIPIQNETNLFKNCELNNNLTSQIIEEGCLRFSSRIGTDHINNIVNDVNKSSLNNMEENACTNKNSNIDNLLSNQNINFNNILPFTKKKNNNCAMPSIDESNSEVIQNNESHSLSINDERYNKSNNQLMEDQINCDQPNNISNHKFKMSLVSKNKNDNFLFLPIKKNVWFKGIIKIVKVEGLIIYRFYLDGKNNFLLSAKKLRGDIFIYSDFLNNNDNVVARIHKSLFNNYYKVVFEEGSLKTVVNLSNEKCLSNKTVKTNNINNVSCVVKYKCNLLGLLGPIKMSMEINIYNGNNEKFLFHNDTPRFFYKYNCYAIRYYDRRHIKNSKKNFIVSLNDASNNRNYHFNKKIVNNITLGTSNNNVNGNNNNLIENNINNIVDNNNSLMNKKNLIDDNKIIFQFGEAIEKNCYIIDCQYPFSPIQAFGIGIITIDSH